MSSLELIQIKPGCVWQVDQLRRILKSPKWVVRFGALKQLDAAQLGTLLRLLFPDSDLVSALSMETGTHSGHLQSYIVSLGYENLLFDGTKFYEDDPFENDRDTTLLAELVEKFEVKVADDLSDVLDTLDDSLQHMPGKQGRLEIKSLMKADRRNRKKLGVAEIGVSHRHQRENLVIFDDSASMGRNTCTRIAGAVKRLTMQANAHLVLVSNTARHWRPGEFTTAAVDLEGEFGGTHYETLAPLMDQHWGVVVTIADYDSSWSAKEVLKERSGSIDTLLDISLVDRPTYLAECLNPLAREVRPLLIAKGSLTYEY